MKKSKYMNLKKFHLKKDNLRPLAKILKNDGVGIMATDTIPGIVCSALSPKGVKRISDLKNREDKKPYITLISQLSDLKLLGIKLSDKEISLLEKIWPAKISLIFPCKQKSKKYLHLGMNSLAIRFPKNIWLRNLIKLTGPIVATSANKKNDPPAKTISEAQKNFGDEVDFYLFGAPYQKENIASTVAKIDFQSKKIQILRPGADLKKLKNQSFL